MVTGVGGAEGRSLEEAPEAATALGKGPYVRALLLQIRKAYG